MSVLRWPALALVLICQTSAQAQQRSSDDPWWFEVEAIIFERDIDTTSLEESFPLAVEAIDTKGLPSFLSDTLYPDYSLLRMGASQCLADEQELEFPAQTAPAPTVKTEPVAVISEIDRFWRNAEFRQQLLQDYQFLDHEFVLENSPTKDWLTQLENTFNTFEFHFERNLEEGPFARRLALYPMLEVPQSEFKPSIQLPNPLYCNWPEERDLIETEYARELKTRRFLASVPRIIDGIEYPFSEQAYVLPSESLSLRKLRRDIQRRRGLNVILHTAWRQNVVIGREKAPWYRIYAGDNLSRQYDYKGLPIAPEQEVDEVMESEDPDLFAQIQAILEQPDTEDNAEIAPPLAFTKIVNRQLDEGFEEVWTLDGRLKIFIEYIGGTPYLHIDSDLNYRKPVYVDWMALDGSSTDDAMPEATETEPNPNAISVVPPDNFLQAYHFDQIRRVISNEIHYFDHPLFGMVFQIRRHKRPDPELPADHPDNQ